MVINKACAQNKEWQDKGYLKTRIAINVSARQINNIDFIGIVDAAIAKSGLESKYLEIELTESSIMQHSNSFYNILDELIKRDICIS